MNAETKGLISNLRGEAKKLRELAKQKRALARQLRSGPVGRRDMVGAIKAEDDAQMYRILAINTRARIVELQSEIKTTGGTV